ncbi:alpha/beta hydrolase [Catenuloplanes atrovinosus]|uniref:Dienelactone hydrolase n=1 Tax=Catenuloplanes atrovinosus TaxID=137266 RepID=A0AAE3YJB1_9ACTN|nr:hypothetical protein [Catenuloplanes atrovinosus]MDR7274834.1 dienelactone hydrolase [Catenuloplanes atrovinosus]
MKLKKITAALAVGVLPLFGAAAAAAPPRDGWGGIVRESVRIPMDGGWTADGELSYPRGAKGRLPVVVLLHGSGKLDMDQTIGDAATFKAVAQSVNRGGVAVLRFHKRGVVGLGPVLSDDPALLYPDKPYEQVVRDAAAAVRFAQASTRVDPARVFMLGHSEGTQVAGNLAAAPGAYGIREPAGVVAMGVVGGAPRDLLYYQAVGRTLGQLHEEVDGDGDGRLTATEASNGLLGRPAEAAAQLRALLLDADGVNDAADADRDGRLAIDAELEPVVRAAIGFDNYPHLTGAPQGLADYLVDFARFAPPATDLARYDGPVLLLNGEADIQTTVRGAIVTDAALAAAGHPDHRLITYPGVSHLMNITTKYLPEPGNPEPAVLRDIVAWLAAHR